SHDGLVEFDRLHNLVNGDISTKIDHLESIGVEQSIDDYLADIVNVAFGGMGNYFALSVHGLAHGLFTFGNADIHGIRREDYLGEKVDTLVPQAAHLVHPGDERPVYYIQGPFVLQSVLYDRQNALIVTVHNKF